MPVIREYFVERYDGRSLPESVSAEDYRRFIDSKLTYKKHGYWSWEPDDGDFYQWDPPVAAEYADYVGTLSDEALYRSNWRMIMEEFEEHGIESVASSTGNIIDIPCNDTFAIATACKIAQDMDDYPVMNEEDNYNLEWELIEETFEDYGRDDLIHLFSELAEHYPALDDILDFEEYDIRQEYKEIAEGHLFRIASNAVSHSGEMYFGYIRRDGEGLLEVDSLHGLRYGISEFCEDYRERLTFGELLTRFVALIKREKSEQDRKINETVQPPFEGI